jgi:predicted permease
MGWADVLLRLRALRDRRRAESELDEELQFHLEMETRKLREAGHGEKQARQAARAHFGGVDLAREECRDARGLTFFENLGRDIRYGARQLRKTPVFTAVALLSLAIGIGANTAVFTLMDAVLLRLLPVTNPEQLAVLKWGTKQEVDVTTAWSTNDESSGRRMTNVFSWRVFDALRREGRSMHSVIGFAPLWRVSVAGNRQAQVMDAVVVSGNYFSGLGVTPAAGRPIAADDDREAGAPALVISYRLWENWFGAAPDAIGRTLFVNGQPCTIVGVTPRRFIGLSTTRRTDLMLPIRARDRIAGAGKDRVPFFDDRFFWIQVVARRNAPEAAIQAETAAVLGSNLPLSAWQGRAPETPHVSADPASQGLSAMRQSYRNPLLILMGVVAITLLMACANLAGLLLARASARGRELTVRLALGARRGRLVRQLLVEGALLSAGGALAGAAVGAWGLKALLAIMDAGGSRSLEIGLDGRVLAFTIGVSAATTLLFALAPALRATRLDLASGLKEETPTVAGPRFGAVRALVAVQIAVAVPLAAGAVLLTRSLANLHSVDVGFNPSSLALFDLSPAQSGYDEVRAGQLYARTLERLRQTPGVVDATLSFQRLLSGWAGNGAVRIDGKARDSRTHFNLVGPRFFETMQIPLAAGRTLRDRDMAGPRVAVVNETFVRRHLPGEPVLGRRFRWSRENPTEVEIVGVVRDAKYDWVRKDVPPTIYAPYTQSHWGWPAKLSIAVRTAAAGASSVSAIRQTMREIDPALPLIDFQSQTAQIDELLVQERLFAWLVSLFGAITLALAAVGIYGLVAASVASRTREIGVRMALGAGRGAVLRMLCGQIGLIAAIGVATGGGAAWALTRLVESQLFGVRPHDPASLLAAAAAVILVSLGAAILPARRAMRIDPVRALRHE